MRKAVFIATGWMGAWCLVAVAHGAPKLQFDRTVYDFGKTSQVAAVTGTFKFKNAGDSLLKIEPPKPTCGCTIASLKPDTLQPGESGELAFTLTLGPSRAQLEKHITVASNDPQTPQVSLTIKADYTPLYEVTPMTLTPKLPFGVNDTDETTTLTRTDGKPLELLRLEPSKPWITAKVDSAAGAEAASARIRVAIKREGTPRRFNEFVQVYAAGQTNTPVTSIYVYGHLMGEISVEPEALYWSVPSGKPAPATGPEATAVRRVTIRSADGKAIQVKNAQSSVKGITVELAPQEGGKSYELVARLEETPAATVSGKLSVETSVAAQAVIEVPVIVNVFKP